MKLKIYPPHLVMITIIEICIITAGVWVLDKFSAC